MLHDTYNVPGWTRLLNDDSQEVSGRCADAERQAAACNCSHVDAPLTPCALLPLCTTALTCQFFAVPVQALIFSLLKRAQAVGWECVLPVLHVVVAADASVLSSRWVLEPAAALPTRLAGC
jgi:hypothetical protein